MMANVLKNKLGAASGVVGKRLDEDLPTKVGLWGEPRKQTPEDRNSYVYQFLDISKTHKIPADPVAAMLYNVWRETGDALSVPTPPDATLGIAGRQYALDRHQLEGLQTSVGQRRRMIADGLVNNPAFMQASSQAKVEVLRRAWEVGQTLGSAEFFIRNRGTLTPKGKPAGFR
jgi:hypothetical protein